MKIQIIGSDEDIHDIGRDIQVMLNTHYDRDVVLHDDTTSHMPHAIEKGYVSIYINRSNDEKPDE